LTRYFKGGEYNVSTQVRNPSCPKVCDYAYVEYGYELKRKI